MNKIFISVFCIGYLPYAPGTFGSLAGIIVGLILEKIGGFPFLITSIPIIFFLGWGASYLYIHKKKCDHDPQEIVIDELLGQLVSYTPFSFFIWWFDDKSHNPALYNWLIAFVLFRVFDIWKPWPISWADKKESALGVMLDDLFAGITSASLICGFLLIL